MSNRSNPESSASGNAPARIPRLRRTTTRPIRYPADDLVNYRQSRTPDLETRTGEQPIPNPEQNRTMENGIIQAEEEPFSVPGIETRRSPSPVATPYMSLSSTSAASSNNSRSPPHQFNEEGTNREGNPHPPDETNAEVPETATPATPMYAWLIRLAVTWIYRCYSYVTTPFRFILSMTIVPALSYIWHFRTRQARSPAQEETIKEERKLWSTWSTNVFIVTAVLFLFWPELIPFFLLTKDFVHKQLVLLFLLTKDFVHNQLVPFFLLTKDFVVHQLNYLYIILGSVTSMLPASNAVVNEHVGILKSYYELQQQDINNLWTLVNDIHGRVGSTPNSIARDIKTIFDINDKATLTFSQEFLEHIQQDEHLQQLLRTTKHTAENFLYESVESFFAQNQQSMFNYADGTRGASILYEITSDSYPTNLWHRVLKLFGLSHVYDEPGNTILPNSRCWTMNGKAGTLSISLAVPIVIKQLAIEMFAHDDDLELFYFEVYSLPLYPVSNERLMLLGNFTFDGNQQSFDIDSTELVSAVMIKILETKRSAPRKTICNVKVLASVED